ncbi:hypothetical protein SLITO_v1c09310 [Spiroplasma litorale]|uniref:Uncharacterized protein n=1 Tax=Spiroplasma litorale TaxID=216942 RepID=A0A0K1W363_9MOLU|nr:hypothetical protein [Spiroplasma litorale]AKX34542.1 hypothetical protein SLITO_v1c09310 [Spiroplasma litorale]
MPGGETTPPNAQEELSKVLKNTELGEIKNPTEKRLKALIVDKNPDLEEFDLKLGSISYKQSIVSSIKYKKSVKVSFTSIIESLNNNNSTETRKV